VIIEFSAYQVNLYAATAALFSAFIWIVAWWRTRYAYMLLAALGWLGLCVYWGLVAVTAGPEPPVDFRAVIGYIRAALFIGITCVSAGKLAWLRVAWTLRAPSRSKPE
jgi:hypothetical protein